MRTDGRKWSGLSPSPSVPRRTIVSAGVNALNPGHTNPRLSTATKTISAAFGHPQRG